MANLSLFINTSNNSLVAGKTSTQQASASNLPLFYGDTLNLNICLLQIPSNYDAANPSASQLETVNLTGLQLYVYIDDGKPDGVVYTQQVDFTVDGEFFKGALSLNTQAIKTLIGASTSANAWLKIGYIQGGLQTTILSAQVTIGVGIPVAALTVPAELTPLSAEAANNTFFPQAPKAGLSIMLMSANGKIIALYAKDNLDGTAELQATPIN